MSDKKWQQEMPPPMLVLCVVIMEISLKVFYTRQYVQSIKNVQLVWM